MNIRELNYDEIYQLKTDLCYNYGEYIVELTEEQKRICDEACCEDDIPDELVYEVYDGFDFVEEDFWCNVNSELLEDLVLEQTEQM